MLQSTLPLAGVRSSETPELSLQSTPPVRRPASSLPSDAARNMAPAPPGRGLAGWRAQGRSW
eukprot:6323288-Alexandrium_andersonii.AAC.1